MKKLNKDEKGLAPLIWAMIILGGIAGTAVVGSTLLAQPDITYNISDTGFSIAGADISWLLIIGLIVIVLFIFLYMRGRDKKEPREIRPYYPPRF